MDNTVKQFIDYLFYIVISSSCNKIIGSNNYYTLSLFMSSLSKVKGANSRKEKLIKTVNSYINALTTKNIKAVSLSIVFKFLSNKYKANENFLIKTSSALQKEKDVSLLY